MAGASRRAAQRLRTRGRGRSRSRSRTHVQIRIHKLTHIRGHTHRQLPPAPVIMSIMLRVRPLKQKRQPRHLQQEHEHHLSPGSSHYPKHQQQAPDQVLLRQV